MKTELPEHPASFARRHPQVWAAFERLAGGLIIGPTNPGEILFLESGLYTATRLVTVLDAGSSHTDASAPQPLRAGKRTAPAILGKGVRVTACDRAVTFAEGAGRLLRSATVS